uniref:Matrin-type domain-containing protein n=1 Tax=Macrostomum lignano TaxID=282301 RepID=A0A1I8FPU8_9PLAT
ASTDLSSHHGLSTQARRQDRHRRRRLLVGFQQGPSERLRQLALETIDLQKDPYFMKNHLGTYECKLCLTLHNNEGSYLAHTQGKKHQQNLARRAAEMAKDSPVQPAPEKPRVDPKRFVKIGLPGYKVTKQRDPDSGQQSMLFQIDYPEIAEEFMSAYEQRVEPPDRLWQYLLFAAEPYETIAFKVPSREVDKDSKRLWSHWNKDAKQFFFQFAFRLDSGGGFGGMGGRTSGVLRDLETQKAKAAAAQMQLAMQQPPPPPPAACLHVRSAAATTASAPTLPPPPPPSSSTA